MVYTRVYVAECTTPDHYYVGSTLRLPFYREEEHAAGGGAKFTSKHGYEGMVVMEMVEPAQASTLEDDLTIALMCRYGWGNVRGGDRTAQSERVLRRFLPKALQPLGPRDVLPLHLRPVSKFPTQLRRLLDRFEVVRGLEDSD